jgi:hypothetical protein
MITPTVGRVVWYHAPGAAQGAQPQAAIIAFVHNDRLVNLHVIDPNGIASGATSVPLIQEGDNISLSGFYCEWMPYQKGQAAKTEAAEAAAQQPAAGALDKVAVTPGAVQDAHDRIDAAHKQAQSALQSIAQIAHATVSNLNV